MKTFKRLHHLTFLPTKINSWIKFLFPAGFEKALSIRRVLTICISLFLTFTILNSSSVFAQSDTLISDNWISPDIPKVKLNQRSAARQVQQTLLSRVATNNNPDIPQALLCSKLKVVFVLDESGSIQGSEITSVKTGALALANALLNSGAQLRLVEFNTTSSIVDLGITEVNSTFITRLNAYLGAGYNSQKYAPASSGNCVGWTNWQAAFNDVSTLDADLVIFFTDGNPTAYNTASGGSCASGTVITAAGGNYVADDALDNAITAANAVKAQGKHMFMVGVGVSPDLNLDNIKAISGTDVFGPSNNILTADYTTPPYEQLAANLTGAVNAICGTELLIKKTSSNSGVCSGKTVVFTNTITNTGGSFNFTAVNVTVKDVYPNGYSNIQIVSPVPAGATISGGNTVNYAIGDMAAGETVTYQVLATVDAPPGDYNNVVSATAFNANEVRDSVSVISGYATKQLDISSCTPVVINDKTYSSTGTYTQQLVSTAGCDSILTINVIIKKPSSSTETISACNTYDWHGKTYTESNTTDTYTMTNIAGCDSVVTLNLTIKKATFSTETISACGTYDWHGKTYTASNNTDTYTTTNVAGCDSVVTLNLTIKQPSSSTETISACVTYDWHGKTYTESNTTDTYTTTNIAGCDSVVTLNLTINPIPVAGITNNTGTTILSGTVSQISLTATGGVTYSWSNGTSVVGISAAYIVTAPGTYTVTVTGTGGCTATRSIVITQTIAAPIIITGVVVNGDCSCALNKGSINITVTGGTSPYTYSWSNGKTTEDISGLAAGIYTVTVKDATGTIKTASFTVVKPVPLTLKTTQTNITCNGLANGTITPVASGGTAPYTYTINTGAGFANGKFSNLAAATYTVTVKDASNCSVSQSVCITQPAAVTITCVKADNSSCSKNGSITVTAKGGTGAYSYSKDGGTTWQSGNQFTALAPSTYSIKVKDANGCVSATTSVVIADNGSDPYESNNTQSVATSVATETSYTARIGSSGDIDWFKFTLASTASCTGTYYLVFDQQTSLGQQFNLYSKTGALLTPSSNGTAGATVLYKVYKLVAGTTYGIKISGTSSLNCYKVKVTKTLPVATIGTRIASSDITTEPVVTIQDAVGVYPNPTRGIFNLVINNFDPGKTAIRIIDARGKVVLTKELQVVNSRQMNTQTVVNLDIQKLTGGIYFVEVVQPNHKQITKIVKE